MSGLYHAPQQLFGAREQAVGAPRDDQAAVVACLHVLPIDGRRNGRELIVVNVRKLADRQKRDVIKGKGDNR